MCKKKRTKKIIETNLKYIVCIIKIEVISISRGKNEIYYKLEFIYNTYKKMSLIMISSEKYKKMRINVKDYSNMIETTKKEIVSINICQNNIVFGISNPKNGYFLDLSEGDLECIRTILLIAETDNNFNETFAVNGNPVTITNDNIKIDDFSISVTKKDITSLIYILNEAKKYI